MLNHLSTQTDNMTLRFSVFIAKVNRQCMDEPKTVSLIVDEIIEHKSHVSHWLKPRFLASFCHL